MTVSRPGPYGSLAWILAAYGVATIAAALTLQWVHLQWYVELLLADLVATLVIFLFSFGLRNSSIYDAFWSVAPPLLLAAGIAAVGSTTRGYLMLSAVSIWAVRLTLNWYRGWPNLGHEDWRYQRLKDQTGRAYWLVSFFGIHVFPTLCVAAGLLPAVVALPSQRPLSVLDYVAASVVLVGTLVELVADEQVRAFKRSAQPGELCNRGLWAFSRHPNYLGEITVWFGVWLFGVAAAPQSWHWTSCGVLTMLTLFVGITIPMQERRAAKRREGWAEYRRTTPMLLPRLTKARQRSPDPG